MSVADRDLEQLHRYGDSMGEALASVGQQLALSVDPDWRDASEEAIERLAASGREFTAADVREIAGTEPSPGAMGAAFRAASQAGRIRLLRYQRSRRITRHGAVEGVWRGVYRHEEDGDGT